MLILWPGLNLMEVMNLSQMPAVGIFNLSLGIQCDILYIYMYFKRYEFSRSEQITS